MKRLFGSPEFKLFAVVGAVVLFIGTLAHIDSNKNQAKPVTSPSSMSDTFAAKSANPS